MPNRNQSADYPLKDSADAIGEQASNRANEASESSRTWREQPPTRSMKVVRRLASVRIKEYIGELVPGFDEHYRRAEQRVTASDPATVELGRTTA